MGRRSAAVRGVIRHRLSEVADSLSGAKAPRLVRVHLCTVASAQISPNDNKTLSGAGNDEWFFNLNFYERFWH
jgi:hypothetical protein